MYINRAHETKTGCETTGLGLHKYIYIDIYIYNYMFIYIYSEIPSGRLYYTKQVALIL